MCGFHSVIVTATGRVYHDPSNSHSKIARKYGLTNIPDKQVYWECEWDGTGRFPTTFCQTRNDSPESSVAENAARRHYQKLLKVLETGILCPPFLSTTYADVKSYVLMYSDLTSRKIQAILDFCSVFEKCYIIRNSYSIADYEHVLVRDKSALVRRLLARYTRSSKILSRLYRDKDVPVRMHVANNPFISTFGLRVLSKDKNPSVRKIALRHCHV